MFDTNLIEEFGIKKPQVQEFAKNLNIEYKFIRACRCADLKYIVNRRVCKTICYSKLSSLSKESSLLFA
jgi:hypothetical protein